MKKYHATLFNLLLVSVLAAQNFNHLEIPVVENGSPYLSPWAGGLNSPQWSKVDLDHDGDLDLYAFDRNGNVHLTFRNDGGEGYKYTPQMAYHFPSVARFAYLRDFNHDGAADFFTHSFDTNDDEDDASIRVYRGKWQGWQLTFERILFPNFDEDLLHYVENGEAENIKSEIPDLPAIDDLDGDGDLDIIALESGGGKVRYYQNTALEMGFSDDTLIFELADDCWGKFYIQPYSTSLDLSGNPDECVVMLTGPNQERNPPVHGGATLCTFDEDGDGDKDFLYGDLIYQALTFGKNSGTKEQAWINEQDTTFPSYDQPVDIVDFPAAFYFDFDNDGARDLLVSPNVPRMAFDYEVGWFYKNQGSNADHNFQLMGTDFMVRDQLDFGTGAVPTFVDYNADGLLDLVVGNGNRWLPNIAANDAFLVLMKNVGTATEPAFEVVDRNWLDFKALSNNGPVTSRPFAWAPTFGDLDTDGDLDLLVGERFGRLFFLENTAGAGQPLAFGPVQPFWQDIVVGSYSYPIIHDFNNDGKPDLVIGEKSGTVNYLPNQGTPTSPSFHPNPDQAPNNVSFGDINTQFGVFGGGHAAPAVLPFPDRTLIVTGSEQGWLSSYEVNPANLNGGPFPLLEEKFGNLRPGNCTHIAFANLNGGDYLEAVIGNDRGGLSIFQSPITVGGLVPAREKRPAFGLHVFPNPTSGLLNVQWETAHFGEANYHLFNALGQVLAAPQGVLWTGQMSGQDATLDLRHLQPGLYFLQVEMDGQVESRRVLVN